MIRYLTRIAAWCSQGLNCVFLFGHHDMTVSARCYLNREKRFWRTGYRLINRIFFWQDDHCYHSHQSDLDFSRDILHRTRDW